MAFASTSFYSSKSNERKYYEYERSPYTSISITALNYQASDRIKSLATPKIRRDTTIREGFSRYISNPTYSGVSEAAAHARCSSRLSDLALTFKRHQLYKYELPVPRPVSRSALRYQSTGRINELSVPRKLSGVR